MSVPSVNVVGKAVLMTAISLVILQFAKPYLPSQANKLLYGA